MTSRLARSAVLLSSLALASVAACSSSGTDAGPTGSTNGPATTKGAPATTPGSIVGDNPALNAFYQPPNPLPPGKPGDVIRSEPLPGAPAGSQAWRVLYHSTGLDGADIAVSGVVIAPTAAAPAGGRPVVSWAHPTTGVADDCAPSGLAAVFALIPGLEPMLTAGYVVAATDYEGLGTPGVHPYLVGISEGRGTLDAARAAAHIADAGAGSDLLLFGHSQGGQASLFAGALAGTYAPELKLLGTAAAAPAGELAELLTADQNSLDGVTLGAYALNAYALVYGPSTPGLDVEALVTPAGFTAVPDLVELCGIVPEQAEKLDAIATPLIGKFYAQNPATVAPWTGLLAENTPGQSKTGAPIYVAQGGSDQLVLPPTTTQLATRLCGLGDPVELKTYPGVPHDTIGYESAGDVVAWMAERVAGSAAPSTC